MTTKRILILLLIALLAVTLAACGDDEPTATATPEAQPAPAVAPNPPAPEASVSNSFEAPNVVLKSYRTRGQFLITTTRQDATTSIQDMALEGAFVKADNVYGSN